MLNDQIVYNFTISHLHASSFPIPAQLCRLSVWHLILPDTLDRVMNPHWETGKSLPSLDDLGKIIIPLYPTVSEEPLRITRAAPFIKDFMLDFLVFFWRKDCTALEREVQKPQDWMIPGHFLAPVFFFKATLAAYGSSQARGQTGTSAASLRYSHSNIRSKPYPRPSHSSR